MKGLFIPGITAKMFKDASLESVEELMSDGKMYDIDYQEPSEDCIRRAEALKVIKQMDIPEDMSVFEIKSHMNVGIFTLSPAQPNPETGHWIVEIWNNREHHTCSNCLRVVDYEPCYHYCPYCGTRMI